MLFGIWYCFKRGREERIKEESAAAKVVLVEGATADEGVSQSVSVEGTPVNVVTAPVEAENVASKDKKQRKSWFR